MTGTFCWWNDCLCLPASVCCLQPVPDDASQQLEPLSLPLPLEPGGAVACCNAKLRCLRAYFAFTGKATLDLGTCLMHGSLPGAYINTKSTGDISYQ